MSSGPDPTAAPGDSGDTRRTSVVIGIVLIGLGAIFLAERALGLDLGRFGWPLFVIVPGLVLFAAGLSAGGREGSGLAVAGGIVTTVGLVLAVQNATDLWETWAYAWALVGPGGSGLGLTLYGLLRNRPEDLSNGLRMLGIGLALFVGFGLFFEGVIGLTGEPFLVGSDVLPVVLIGIGVAVLAWTLLKGRRA